MCFVIESRWNVKGVSYNNFSWNFELRSLKTLISEMEEIMGFPANKFCWKILPKLTIWVICIIANIA